MKPNLLIIDDNVDFVKSVETVLNEFSIQKAYHPDLAIPLLNRDIDVVLLDLVFDESRNEVFEGLEFIPFIKNQYPDLSIIVMTNYSSIDTTVTAIKSGASDFFNKKDLNWIEWKTRLLNYAQSSQKIRLLERKNYELEIQHDDSELIGTSDSMDFIRKRLKDLALNSPDATIFLTGETGTGKNLAVNYFRKFSIRQDRPYKEFSILELSESLVESELFGHVKGAFTGATQEKKGLFELANGGILFLDEIGDYDLRIQTKILRFLDEKIITPVGSGKSKKLELQLILASNQDIPGLIIEKKFREDLYQRINKIRIELPPLRERIEDIELLALHFFHHFKEKEKTKLVSINSEVLSIFRNYPWPGNIRELQSVIWDACTKARLFGDTVLQIKHVKREITEPYPSIFSSTNCDNSLGNQEKIAILELQSIDSALQKSFGQKAVAAEMLGINADQMRYKVFKLKKEFPELFARHKHLAQAYKTLI